MPAESFNSASPLALLSSHWRNKALLCVLLWLVFSVPYVLISYFPLFTPGEFKPSAIDRWVAFTPGWVWVYQSAYLLIPLAPLLTRTRAGLVLYTRGFCAMTIVGMTILLLMPMRAPRPADPPHVGMYALLISYDRPVNTFPSLHVALVVQSLAFGYWQSRAGRKRTILMSAGVVWAVLIAFSTLATKQHYAVDIPAGAALGWASHWWAARNVRVVPAVANTTSLQRVP